MRISPDNRQLRRFGWTVGVILAVIGIWPAVIHEEGVRWWALVPGVLLTVLGAVAPRLLVGIHDVWLKLGHGLCWVNTRIIMGILFYGLITPVGLLMRVLGHDPMHRRFSPDLDTYRVVREPRPAAHLNHQF